MTRYVTALELATYLNGTTELADLTDGWIAQAEILLDMISADVEAAAGIKLEAETGTVTLPGVWGRDLELPEGPVRAVTAVTVNGESLAADGYWWNERSLIRRGVASGDELDSPPDPGAAGGADTRAGSSWGGPSTTVTVAYSWGFEDVPEIVKALVLRIAARTFGNVAQVTQETLAVYSVSYGQSTNLNDGSHVTSAERRRLRQVLGRTNGGSISTVAR